MEKLNVWQKLMEVQVKLKAPKNQKNDFGNYNYRNCEDILEAVKPIAKELGCVVILDDCIKVFDGRFYVEATASFINTEDGERIEASANARETEIKKGMDSAQITGSASSYARKYALNGLFAIDDAKDADTNEAKKLENEEARKDAEKQEKLKKQKIGKAELEILEDMVIDTESDPILVKKNYNIKEFSDMTLEQYYDCIRLMQKKIDGKK